MKKYKSFLSLFLFLLLMVLSTNTKAVFAAAGDRTAPYRAWNNHRFTFQEYSWDTPKEVEVQLRAMFTGEEANYLVQSENMFNDVPADDEQWIVMGFNLKYVSGPEEPLYACDVIWSGGSFFTTTGQKISPISTAIFSNELEGYGEYDVELYPGGESEVYYGILVKKSAGLPLVRIATGYDETAYQTIYTWFSTDPYYNEPVQAPANMQAVPNSYNSVKASWTAVSGMSGYEIYRSTSSTGTFTKIATTTSTSYIDTSLSAGTAYYYKVRAYKTGTQTTYSNFSSVVSAKPVIAAPSSVKAASSSYNSIITSWAAVSGANGYEVYRAASGTGAYSLAGSTTSTSFNNGVLTTNNQYYYKIRAYRNVGSTKVYSNYSAVVSAKPILAAPTSAKAVSSSYNSIRTSWMAVSGASGYEVYRATSSTGTYSLVGSTASTSTSFNNGALTTNKTFYYKIRAYRTIGITKVYSNYSAIVNAKPIPPVPANFKASRLSSTSIKLTWSSVTGANGYEIYRSTTSAGTYSLLKGTTSLYYTNSSLATGRTYYYKLRAYRTVGTTKVYSGWTTIISAKP
jgi:fibronectin type 3 domain-containing protein